MSQRRITPSEHAAARAAHPDCAVAGVLGVLPGIAGLLQANEVFKLLLGVGETLVGRLLMFDAMSTEFSEVKIWRDPACPACGEGTIQ